jgi:type IV pilus assembly protein PilW
MSTPAKLFRLPLASREHGLTMIELLVTLLILGAVMMGLAQLLTTNSLNANATGALAKLADTGRTAIQLLSTDIRRAGYLGGNIDNQNATTMIRGTVGVAPTESACDPATTNWASMVGQPIFGLNDTNMGYACIANGDYTRGDILTLRYAIAPPIAAADMQDGTLYLRATMIDGRLFLKQPAADVNNELNDPTVRDFELAAHAYFVGPTGRRCQDREIPALFRIAIGDNGLPTEPQELLAGVENLQFRYKIGNRYFDADDVTDWLAVDAVETTVLVRAECPEAGLENDQTFVMADTSLTPDDPNDAGEPDDIGDWDYRRQVFTTTTQLRNLRN